MVEACHGAQHVAQASASETSNADVIPHTLTVPLMQTDQEWNAMTGVSLSSSDSDWDTAPGHRRAAAHADSAFLNDNGGVHIVQVAEEWCGLAAGVGDSDDKSALAWRARRRPGSEADASFSAAAAEAAGSISGLPVANDPPPAVLLRQPICPQSTVFVFFTFLHTLDFGLRVVCFSFFVRHCLFLSTATSLVGQVVGTIIAVWVTFHDADVLLMLHRQTSVLARAGLFFLAFFFGGCCQIIQVKRAWARQIHAAEVLTECGSAGDYDDRATPASSLPIILGSERMMPVALITGVPFLLVIWLWIEHCGYLPTCTEYLGYAPVMWLTHTVLISTVSLGLAEIDVAVSSYVFKQYHYEPERRLRLQKSFFPVLHVLFRMVEVSLRLVVLTGWAREAFRWLPLLDYVLGVFLLHLCSPATESCIVHVVAGIGLLVADMGHFVDLPNFAGPARRITFSLGVFRFFSFVSLVVVYMRKQKERTCCWDETMHLCVLLTLGTVYYAFWLVPQIRKRGDDLHTAARVGDVGRIRTLLLPGVNGEVLDVNAEAKDRKGKTPLMLAAEGGHVDVLEQLLGSGAHINDVADIDGNTCLHHAAMNRQVAACVLLKKAGAVTEVRNLSGLSPESVVPQPRAGRLDPTFNELMGLLQLTDDDMQRRQCVVDGGAGAEQSSWTASPKESHPRSSGSNSWTSKRHYTVKMAPTAGLQLRTLFPDVEKDDTPSPRVLQSVSSLVLSRAFGAFARRLLQRHDQRVGGVPLGALQRVKELGRGGFGRVIEVELPHSNGLWMRRSEPRRYALKLHLKRHPDQAASEVLALQRADHPFIVHLVHAFSFSRFFALLLELCPTDLNRLLCEKADCGRSLGLQSQVAARYMGQAGLALAHLHRNEKIVFRDVKPENILISDQDQAKLTDFGLAKVVTSAESMQMCGTMGFLPPELLSGESSFIHGSQGVCSPGGRCNPGWDPFKADAYSFGVTLQVALLGEDGAFKKTIRRKGPMMLPLHLSEAENAELLAQLRENGRLSPEAYALLVDRLLPHHPARRSRLTDVEVLNHPFFLQELGCDDLEKHLLPPFYGKS